MYESLTHLFRASMPEFLGNLMAAVVLAAAGWGAKKTRDRLRARRLPEESTD